MLPRVFAPIVVAVCLALAAPASAAPAGAALSAAYQAAVPAEIGAATDASFSVTVTNTGDETWALGSGAGAVTLAYHWYDAFGKVVVWDGLRTPLGAAGATVIPTKGVTVTATVRAPEKPGPYFLRLALVKEGVAWLPPSEPYAVSVTPAYNARISQPALVTALGGETYTLPITVTNAGAVAWSAAGEGRVSLSSHWHDVGGNTVVWDGPRTALPRDVAPGTSVTLNATVTAPKALGRYRLTIDLVREGVAWFASLGSAPAQAEVTVAPITFAAGYQAGASAAAYVGQKRELPVSVTNTGNVPWGAQYEVRLGYHITTAKGDLLVWDGPRTLLGEVPVGGTKQVMLSYTAPTAIGDYVLSIDAVREGIGWFGGMGSAPLRLPMRVDSGYQVGYGVTTTPPQVTIGARVPVQVQVDNYGARPLVAAGENPVHLAYHIYDSAGRTVVWDGLRGILPGDIPPGQSAIVETEVQMPSLVGEYTVSWDLVQEGVAWLSQFGIAGKREPVSVRPGVTFYGKGFGHGLGMSQYGAQGMATGAGGRPPMTGEQIVSYYYPGAALTPIPAGGPNTQIRVLLSQPSSQGRYSCGAAYFAGSLANVVSAGGMRVLNEGAGNALIFLAAPTVTVQIQATGGVVKVWNQAASPPQLVYSGPGPVVTVPLDPAQPTLFEEKGTYRGNLRFSNLGNTLRVLNVVSYDDYVRAVVPLEMLDKWHLEAYKAQAIAARTYAYSSYAGGARDYDVLDDQSDQCYGGVKMRSGRVVEKDTTNRAVDLTRGLVLTYNGVAIRAYFASSNGGYSKALGCWNDNARVTATSVVCSASPPYLSPVPDPWDLAVSVPAPNRNASWQVTFTSDEIRSAVLAMRGVDIGTLLSVDLSNRSPAVVGHVTSVKVMGTNASVDLPADKLLRDRLRLRSTMVRLAPWN